MSRRYTRTGTDSWNTRPPMLEARRRHIHGPIEPMEPPCTRMPLSTVIMCWGLALLAVGILVASRWA